MKLPVLVICLFKVPGKSYINKQQNTLKSKREPLHITYCYLNVSQLLNNFKLETQKIWVLEYFLFIRLSLSSWKQSHNVFTLWNCILCLCHVTECECKPTKKWACLLIPYCKAVVDHTPVSGKILSTSWACLNSMIMWFFFSL